MITSVDMFIFQVSPLLTASVVVSQSGRCLANKMVSLAVSFFNLVITSVTGIPMKVSDPSFYSLHTANSIADRWLERSSVRSESVRSESVRSESVRSESVRS